MTNSLAGASYSSSGEPICSMRPSLITTISSATSSASSWSWVTNTVVTCTSSCRRRSQSRSSLRTLASSAPNGSSSSSTVGSTASARASAMRWRWPPESCDGSRSANCSRCTSSSSSSTRLRTSSFGRLPDLQPERHVAAHGHVLERRVVLEHEADVALLRGQVRGVDPLDLDRALVGLVEPGDDAQQRGLAAPARAQQRGELAGGDADGHVVEGDELAEPLADVRRPRCSWAHPHDTSSFGRTNETTTMQATDTRASRKAVA